MPTSDAGAIEKAAVSSGGYAPGETATFDLRVKNEGAKPIENANVRVMLAKILEGDGYSVSGQYAYLDTIPAAGGEAVLKLSYTVGMADVGNDDLRIVAMATVPVPGKPTINVTCESEPIPIASEVYRLAAKLEITNRGTGTNYAFTTGDIIQGTFTVTNESTSALSGIRAVVDPAVNITGDTFSLGVGAEKQLPFTYKVTEDDILAQELSFTATASCAETTAKDTLAVELEEIRREAKLTWIETSSPADSRGYMPNDWITWDFNIENVGNVSIVKARLLTVDRIVIDPSPDDLYSLTMEMDFETRILFSTATARDPIPVGGNMTMLITAQVKNYEETISAWGNFSADGISSSRTEAEPIKAAAEPPSVDIVWAETSTPADGVDYMVGERITWDIRVTNTSSRQITDASFNSENCGLFNGDGYTHITGENFFNGSLYTDATIPVINAGAVLILKAYFDAKNPGAITASGAFRAGDLVVSTASDPITVMDEPLNAALSWRETSVPTGGSYGPGDTITWDLTVTNNGNAPIQSFSMVSRDYAAISGNGIRRSSSATDGTYRYNGTQSIAGHSSLTFTVQREIDSFDYNKSISPTVTFTAKGSSVEASPTAITILRKTSVDVTTDPDSVTVEQGSEFDIEFWAENTTSNSIADMVRLIVTIPDGIDVVGTPEPLLNCDGDWIDSDGDSYWALPSMGYMRYEDKVGFKMRLKVADSITDDLQILVMGQMGGMIEDAVKELPVEVELSFDKPFEECTLKELAEKYQATEDDLGKIISIPMKQHYSVDGKYINTNLSTFRLQVIGVYHDERVSGGKAKFTLRFIEAPVCERMSTVDDVTNGLDGTNVMKPFLNNDSEYSFFGNLPDELKEVITEVYKPTSCSITATGTSSRDFKMTHGEPRNLALKVWPLSASEILGESSSYAVSGEGERYAWFVDHNAKDDICVIWDPNGRSTTNILTETMHVAFWTRSLTATYDSSNKRAKYGYVGIASVSPSGGSHTPSSYNGAAPGLCIG